MTFEVNFKKVHIYCFVAVLTNAKMTSFRPTYSAVVANKWMWKMARFGLKSEYGFGKHRWHSLTKNSEGQNLPGKKGKLSYNI